MKGFRYYSRDLTLALDRDSCSGCGMCVEVCPHGVFSVEQGKAAVVNREECMECGACSRNCPASAIRSGAGVGCAAAIIGGLLKGRPPECGCSCSESQKT